MNENTTDNDKDTPGGDATDANNGATPPESADVLAEAVDTDAANAPGPANDSGDETGADSGNESGIDAADIDPQAAIIAELEADLADQKEHALRALAEAENMRKRADKQVHDASRYGASSFARDMLVVADNLERALAAVPETGPDGEQSAELLPQLREGVQMTLRDLESKLESHSVKKVEPQLGEKFDHNLHQAMFEAETGDYPAGTIAQVMQPGYTLHDRLLRAAMVGVAKAPAAAAPVEETPDATDAAENNDAA